MQWSDTTAYHLAEGLSQSRDVQWVFYELIGRCYHNQHLLNLGTRLSPQLLSSDYGKGFHHLETPQVKQSRVLCADIGLLIATSHAGLEKWVPPSSAKWSKNDIS